MPWPRWRPLRRAPVQQVPGYQLSTFGDPATAAEQDLLDGLPCFQRRLLPDTTQHLTATALELGRRLYRDLQVVQASRRWNVGAPDPLEFAPGDALALRYFATDPLIRQSIRILSSLDQPLAAAQVRHHRLDLRRRVRHNLTLAQAQFDAATYFLPVTSAIGILASTPPADQLAEAIRLPFPAVSVYFGADLVSRVRGPLWKW